MVQRFSGVEVAAHVAQPGVDGDGDIVNASRLLRCFGGVWLAEDYRRAFVPIMTLLKQPLEDCGEETGQEATGS